MPLFLRFDGLPENVIFLAEIYKIKFRKSLNLILREWRSRTQKTAGGQFFWRQPVQAESNNWEISIFRRWKGNSRPRNWHQFYSRFSGTRSRKRSRAGFGQHDCRTARRINRLKSIIWKKEPTVECFRKSVFCFCKLKLKVQVRGEFIKSHRRWAIDQAPLVFSGQRWSSSLPRQIKTI